LPGDRPRDTLGKWCWRSLMHDDRPDAGSVEDDDLTAFNRVRPRLFGIAYRMLGSAADAEDIVQDVWLRWQTTDRSVVLDAPAFLATIAMRLSINVAQSARSRQETYVGAWIPEPVDTGDDPHLGAERGEALEFAVLLLLEKLSPAERAAYVLREAFDYPYPQIASILQIEEANSRQMVSRARKHIVSGRRASVGVSERRRLLGALIAAAQKGDLAALEQLFAADVVSSADGGGIVRAARIPVEGRERVAKFITSVAPHFWKGVEVIFIEANGQPAALILREGSAVAMATIDATTEGIVQILWVMRPSKLRGISQMQPKLPQAAILS
jgi:RNA polymerase sigma-70 factor (TIGR02957 family)